MESAVKYLNNAQHLDIVQRAENLFTNLLTEESKSSLAKKLIAYANDTTIQSSYVQLKGDQMVIYITGKDNIDNRDQNKCLLKFYSKEDKTWDVKILAQNKNNKEILDYLLQHLCV